MKGPGCRGSIQKPSDPVRTIKKRVHCDPSSLQLQKSFILCRASMFHVEIVGLKLAFIQPYENNTNKKKEENSAYQVTVCFSCASQMRTENKSH